MNGRKASRPASWWAVLSSLVLLAGLLLSGSAAGKRESVPGNDWLRYGFDASGNGFTPETIITSANAAALRPAPRWPVPVGAGGATQPIVANELVYFGSWDGHEYAVPSVGGTRPGWSTYLGRTDAGDCGGGGVAGAGAIASVKLPGEDVPRSLLFVGGGGTDAVGGGQARMFALDALTGAVVWQTPIGDAPSTFIWSSPVVYTHTVGGAEQTDVYVGISSFSDCPLVVGGIVELDAATGAIVHRFDAVPSGCTGASVWGSITIDAGDGSLYASTGNAGPCDQDEPYAVALLKLQASDLSLVDKWQIPPEEQARADPDFGSMPTLFEGTISPGGAMRPLVGIANKNGIYYVFDRGSLGSGPVAQLTIAKSGSDPENGDGSISPSAYDGNLVYVAGGTTTIGGMEYRGSVRAYNPDDFGAPVWERGIPEGPVIASVSAAPGIVAVGAGSYTYVLSSKDGSVLFRAGTDQPTVFWGAPSISHGTLYEGDAGGLLHAYTALLGVTTDSLPNAFVSAGYSKTLTAEGGSRQYTWRLAGGRLPRGLALSSTGRISGTPTSTGKYSFTVGVSDSGTPQQTATSPLTITVSR
jgi:outer membrane protein assembly factor BamB